MAIISIDRLNRHVTLSIYLHEPNERIYMPILKTTPKEIITNLTSLNEKEIALSQRKRKDAGYQAIQKEIDHIRPLIPFPILSHHDRMRNRGKTSVAGVRHWVCSRCHLSIPLGNRARLQLMNDISICDSCGCYLYLIEETIIDESQKTASQPDLSKLRPQRKGLAKTKKNASLNTTRPSRSSKKKSDLALA